MILEELEIEAHQAGEFRFERIGQIIEAHVDRPAERFEVGIVPVRQAAAFGQLPQPFDQVEIGAVRWQKAKLHPQRSRVVPHKMAALITRVVHHEGHFGARVFFVDLAQQCDHAQRVYIPGRADTDEFLTVAIDGSQNVVASLARRGLHQDSGKAPDHAQKGPHHEMLLMSLLELGWDAKSHLFYELDHRGEGVFIDRKTRLRSRSEIT